jgi:hypothetical protein
MAFADLPEFQERQSVSSSNLCHLALCGDHPLLGDLNVSQLLQDLQLQQPKSAIRHLLRRALKLLYRTVMNPMLDDLVGRQLRCTGH